MRHRIGIKKSKIRKIKRTQRDYHRKTFRNPFFSKRNSAKLKLQINIFLAIIIAGGLLYLLSFSNLFHINNIEINGDREITNNLINELASEQLNRRHWLIFSQSSLLFFQTSELKENIGKYLALQTLSIKKKYRHGLSISYKEKDSQAYLLNQGQTFALDQDSKIISILDSLPADANLPVFSYQEKNMHIGEKLSDSSLITESYDIYRIWHQLEIKPNIKKLLVSDNPEEIKIETADGWKVFLSRSYDLNKQLISLKRLWLEKGKDFTGLEYVDLRVDGWLYYK